MYKHFFSYAVCIDINLGIIQVQYNVLIRNRNNHKRQKHVYYIMFCRMNFPFSLFLWPCFYAKCNFKTLQKLKYCDNANKKRHKNIVKSEIFKNLDLHQKGLSKNFEANVFVVILSGLFFSHLYRFHHCTPLIILFQYKNVYKSQ